MGLFRSFKQKLSTKKDEKVSSQAKEKEEPTAAQSAAKMTILPPQGKTLLQSEIGSELIKTQSPLADLKCFEGSRCEVRTLNNMLVTIGYVVKIVEHDIFLEFRNSKFEVPLVGSKVKVNILNARVGFASVQGVVVISDSAQLVIRNVEILAKSESRHAYRVSTNIKTTMEPIMKTFSASGPIDVEVKNISLSGICVHTKGELEAKKTYTVQLPLGDFKCLVMVRVVRWRKLDGGITEYGCTLESLVDSDTESLNGFIFEEQQTQLKQLR